MAGRKDNAQAVNRLGAIPVSPLAKATYDPVHQAATVETALPLGFLQMRQ